MTKLTVITPTYNRAHTLRRTFESLQNQTFKDFKWMIMDDGSTDDTTLLVEQLIKESNFPIEYHKNENAKKFYTVFKGIEQVDTQYFTIIDSDDAYPKEALNILIKEADQLDPSQYISVIGHSEDENGKLYGNLFPNNGFDGSVLEMRYKHRIKGDKNGLFITAPYQKYLNQFDYEKYKGKYAPQKIFFNIYDAAGMKTRFINKIIRTYYFDQTDQASMTNDRIKPTSYKGLREAHLSFLNSYGHQLIFYPKALIRNTVGFHQYTFLLKESTGVALTSVKPFLIKIFAACLYPLSYIYTKKQHKETL